MPVLIKGGRIIDPSTGINEIGDLAFDGAVISQTPAAPAETEQIDASGLWVVPGLVDTHVHLREPGQEHKEDIATGLRAAAAGGFSAVLSMPNTDPANDRPEVTRLIIERARALGGSRVYPVAAATVGRQGKTLSPMAELLAAGAVAFSDDGSGLADSQVMEQALNACRELNVPFAQHAEDPALAAKGVIHDGAVAEQLGVPGWPAAAEEAMVARDIGLLESTGARLHVQHVSTAGAVSRIRRAQEQGLPVTAEVTPHHLLLTDRIALEVDTMAKVNPPLRPQRHVDACVKALADGTIDIMATDHAPHTHQDKQGGLERAAFGIVGLETAVPLLLSLVERGLLTPNRIIEAMSTAPCRIFGLPGGTLRPGSPADITLIDPALVHRINPATFESKGRNTPFAGIEVPGKVVRTIVDGQTIFTSH